MANPEFLYVSMRRSTREALKNLFVILQVEGKDLDERLFELASRAFAANSTPLKGHSLRKRARNKQTRKQIDIKLNTAMELREIHNRLFSYLPWQSWDWLMNELIKIARESMYEKKEDLEVYMPRQD